MLTSDFDVVIPLFCRAGRRLRSAEWYSRGTKGGRDAIASGNARITFKVLKAAESDRKWPEVHRSTFSKVKCPIHRSKVAISAQIRRGGITEENQALRSNRDFS